LIEISNNTFNKWNCSILEINGEADHLHILFEAPPQVQLSKLINNFKTVTSRLIRRDYAGYLANFYWKPFFWSESYLILSTGGATIDIIRQYIENQSTPPE
jgi:putative transposase